MLSPSYPLHFPLTGPSLAPVPKYPSPSPRSGSRLPSWQPKGYYCTEIWPHSCIHSSYKAPFHSHTRSFTVGTPLPASQLDKHPNTAFTSMIHHNPGRTGTSKASDQAVLPSSHIPLTHPSSLTVPSRPCSALALCEGDFLRQFITPPLVSPQLGSWCSRAGPEMRTPWSPRVTPESGLACPIPHMEG